MSVRRLVSLPVLVLMAASVLVLAGEEPLHGGTPPPTVRLIGAAKSTEVGRFPREPVYPDFGTYVASVGGAFEIRVRRTGAKTFDVRQFTRDGTGKPKEVRRLPSNTIGELYQGLRRFFEVVVRDAGGTTVAKQLLPFCPGGWEQSRVDDTGPDLATYPMFCAGTELTRATIFGIDRGWGVAAPFASEHGFKLKDGRYDVEVRIAQEYVDLLRVDPARARVTLKMKVVTVDDPHPCEPSHCDDPIPLGEGGSPARGTETAGTETGGTASADPPNVHSNAGGLPDLIALPAFNLTTFEDPDGGADLLAFAANGWNAGPGPLVVEGFRKPGARLMNAYQYLYDRGVKVERRNVGTLEFDRRDGHQHWHFTDFARYRLLDSTKQQVVRSGKEAFCLAPTDPIDLTLPGANLIPGSTGLHTACGQPNSIWIREILDPGWGDTYVQWVPGQSFDLTGVANGTYYVEVTVNPDRRLHERRLDNNTALVKITLGGKPGKRTVKPAG